MTCRRNVGGCGYEFCYKCKRPWSEHGSHTGGYYRCKYYQEAADKSLLTFEAYDQQELKKLSDAEGLVSTKQVELMTRASSQVAQHESGIEHAVNTIAKFEREAMEAVNRITGGNVGDTESKDQPTVEQDSKDQPVARSMRTVASLVGAIRSRIGAGRVALTRQTSTDTELALRDAAIKHAKAAQVTRQLEVVRTALEALCEYHRVEMWSTVHLYYMAKGPEYTLIEFKLTHLRGFADTLFRLTNSTPDSPKSLMALPARDLAVTATALAKFARGLREEIEFMNAFDDSAAGLRAQMTSP